MTTFKKAKKNWSKRSVIAWFGNRGEEISASAIKWFRVGTLIDYDGKEQAALAIVLADTTNPGEIDLYCTDSYCLELYDSIRK